MLKHFKQFIDNISTNRKEPLTSLIVSLYNDAEIAFNYRTGE